jgi:hypothetical protein
MALVGNLRELPLTELIQICCAFHNTTHIKLDFGNSSGSVFLKNWEIIDAEIGDLKGEKAFYKILSHKDGNFVTETNTDFSPMRTIERSWRELLYESMRLVNEEKIEVADSNSLHTSPSQKEILEDDEVIDLEILDKSTNSDLNQQLVDEVKNQTNVHFSSEDKEQFELGVQNSSDEHDALLQKLLSSGVVKGGVVIDEDGSTICEISENDPKIKQLASMVKGIEDIVMSTFYLGDLDGAILEIEQKSLLVKNFQNLSLVFARPERVPIVRAFEGVQKAFEGAFLELQK